MNRRNKIMKNEIIDYDSIVSDLYTGPNFDVNKHFIESLSALTFNYSNKKQRIENLNQIVTDTNESYKYKSEKLVNILLDNYQTFMNIGKYVERIDLNLTNILSKIYSSHRHSKKLLRPSSKFKKRCRRIYNRLYEIFKRSTRGPKQRK